MFKRVLAAALAVASPLVSVSVPTVLAAASAPSQARGYCGTDSYVNSRGNCVPRPRHSKTVPKDATAQCRDGTYSFSQSRRGTCSHHGGVARWL